MSGWKPPADVPRRVVCAAIRAQDGELLIGIRHYSPDMHRQIEQRVDGDKFKRRRPDDQGFVDQWGRWMDRREALAVAKANGQIYRPCTEGGRLYSEALY